LQHTFVGRKGDLESLYLDNFYCAFSQSEQRHILGSDGVNHPYENFLHYWGSRAHNGLLPRMLFTDQKTYLVELLMKQDQMSMACSIESRVPFLDHPFVEFAARVPDEMKIHGGCAKYILKRAVEDLLPRSIIYRKKMGFPTPLRQWLLSEKAQPLLALLVSRDGLLAEHLNGDAVRRLLERHVKGEEDATDRIWRLLNLQVLGDIFLTGRRDATDGLLASAADTYAH
jgi:asparagine synthase (glutamine-hydrolysing)